MTQGISIHIGLNRVNPKHYRDEFERPWDGALRACEFDALVLQTLAQGRGFHSTLILTEQATAATVVKAISRAARRLQTGDTLLITYSGHGGQVADEAGDETDTLDETWVLYDRQLLDDELYKLWASFQPGVRIVVLADSCHSGTATRQGATQRNLAWSQLSPTSNERYRLLPLKASGATYRANRRLYKNRQKANPGGDHSPVQASVLLISGCQDEQVARDGEQHGLFTATLLRVWDQGNFTGNYRQLHSQICQQMPAEQQPNLFTFGTQAATLEHLPVFALG